MNSFSFLALGSKYPQYFDNILSEQAIKQYTQINEYLTNEWKNPDKHYNLRQINGCLSKLSSSLFQINRLISHHTNLLLRIQRMNFNIGKIKFSLPFAIYLDEACYDFEFLIFQSRSTLDKLSWFINKLYNQNSNSFSDLRNTLTKTFPKSNDEFINYIIDLLEQAKWLEDFMISKGNYKSIRDELAHLSSFNEKTDYCFNILPFNNNEFIVTDFESHGISLFNSTFKIS